MATKDPAVKTLKGLRDELRLKMHLAGMDLKTEWQRLEPQIDHAVSEAAVVSGEVLADLQKRLEEFRRRMS